MATNIKRTKKYKALLAVGLTDEKAQGVMNPASTSPLDILLEGGWNEDEARAILAGGTVEPDEPLDPAEALVESSPYSYTKGRVYVTTSIIEACVRVIKTGKPEIVKTSGNGRTKAVLIKREDSGDASIQNLA